jgi:hypothetical protein
LSGSVCIAALPELRLGGKRPGVKCYGLGWAATGGPDSTAVGGRIEKILFMGEIKGRPKKAVKQEKNIGFFVTKLQYVVIQRKAEKAGVNISDYMRQVAVFGEVKAKWTEEERQMVKKLIGISADIHMLVERARAEGAVQTALFFSKYRDIMDAIIKNLCHER